jgi:hypothetical protein
LQKIFSLTPQGKLVNGTIKCRVVMALAWALYSQLSDQWTTLRPRAFLAEGAAIYLVFAILLMPLNWVLEGMKWRLFLSGPYSLSLRQALRAIFTGLTFALFTPFRLGDYVGRILAVEPDRNGPVVVATLAASLCQLLVLLLCGGVGLFYFASQVLTFSPRDYKYFLISGLLGTIILLLCILYIRDLVQFALRQKVIRAYKDKLQPLAQMLDDYDVRTFAKALLLALLRYLVYLSQFVLLLYFGKVSVPMVLAYAGVASIFLIQTSLPLPPALGLLARSEVALLIWSPFTTDPLPVLFASFGLFVINLALPSLIGLGALLRINVLESLGYGKTKN